MAISISLWGYAAARGRDTVRNNPNSKINAKMLDRIVALTKRLDEIPLEVRSTGFTDKVNGEEILRAVYFDFDLINRPGLLALIARMNRRGTIITPSLDDLSTGGSTSDAEMKALRQIEGSAVAILALDNPSIAPYVDSVCPIDVDDISEIVMSGADARPKLYRRIIGYRAHRGGTRSQVSDVPTDYCRFIYRRGELFLESKEGDFTKPQGPIFQDALLEHENIQFNLFDKLEFGSKV